MPKNTKSNLAIWKIDCNHRLLAGYSTAQTIEKIISIYNDKEDLRDYEKLVKIPLEADIIEEKNIIIFNKQRKSTGWKNFIGDLVSSEHQNINDRRIFFSLNNDFLCFIFDETDIFLITAGAGYHAIQEFIDEGFPLEIAKKIFTGKFQHAETRGLTGISYSKSENFRRSYAFSRQEAFGKIWKKLSGKLDSDIINNSPELKLVIDPTKKINAEMKSSFTFRKSVTFKQIVQLTKALQALPEASEEKSKKFKFLETLREVKSTDTKEKIKNSLLEKIYDILKNDKFENAKDFDFCHPTEVYAFFAGCDYTIKSKSLPPDDYPRAEDVLKFLKAQDLVKLDNSDEFIKSFNSLQFTFKKESDDEKPISTGLIRYFHGEMVVDERTYFIVDSKYYEPVGTFLENLLEDFIFEVFEDKGILIDKIPFINWEKNAEGKHMEGEFNELQAEQDSFYYGDKIFVGTERGQIELFDLLYVTDDELYIIQVKGRFGASTRDACSQIEIAAEIIEEDMKNECKILKKYYLDWKNTIGNDLTEAQFLNLFREKKKVYVLACSTSVGFTKAVFQSKKLTSHIAQFETLGLSHLFKGKNYKFNIQHINRD